MMTNLMREHPLQIERMAAPVILQPLPLRRISVHNPCRITLLVFFTEGDAFSAPVVCACPIGLECVFVCLDQDTSLFEGDSELFLHPFDDVRTDVCISELRVSRRRCFRLLCLCGRFAGDCTQSYKHAQ